MGSLLLWKNATFFDDFVFYAITKIIYHFASLSAESLGYSSERVLRAPGSTLPICPIVAINSRKDLNDPQMPPPCGFQCHHRQLGGNPHFNPLR